MSRQDRREHPVAALIGRMLGSLILAVFVLLVLRALWEIATWAMGVG